MIMITLGLLNISYATSELEEVDFVSIDPDGYADTTHVSDGKKYGDGNIQIRSDVTGGKKGDKITLTVSIKEEFLNNIISEKEKVEGTIRYSDRLFSNVNIVENDAWKGTVSVEDGSNEYPRF